ncbi:helix-turn-helix domain-containing protein [Catenuloplanes nepalensis]|uniref:helix-turn-helix domain-containing protein n=1 Tax=Catenuloplanes nepalensis TaxID=587533 RepID=UPI0027D7AD17|nr:helix-turn-helix transcriptional regulator [Catenuloplanes nepalensis]
MPNAPSRRRAARSPLDHSPRRLRAQRVIAGLRLSELARRAEISKGTLSELESGTRNASPETLDKIATALGCTIADLTPGRRTAA